MKQVVVALPPLSYLPDQIRELTSRIAALEAKTPTLLTVEDAAARYQVSIRTVRRWVAERRVKVVRIGRVVRIDVTND